MNNGGGMGMGGAVAVGALAGGAGILGGMMSADAMDDDGGMF